MPKQSKSKSLKQSPMLKNRAAINGLAALNAALAAMQIHRLSLLEARCLLFLNRKTEDGDRRRPLKWVADELGEQDESFYLTRRVAEDLYERGLVGLSQRKEASDGEARRNAKKLRIWLTASGVKLLKEAGKTVNLDAEFILNSKNKPNKI